MKVQIFVYGSLLKGLLNHYVLEDINAEFVMKDSIKASLFTSNWQWPFMVLKGETTIVGEVYSIEEERIGRLDRLEGYYADRPEHENLFMRREIETLKGNKVIVYEGRDPRLLQNAVHIVDGDWKKALKERKNANSKKNN